MKVNRRCFREAPPSWPRHYDKQKEDGAWIYQSMFYSYKAPMGMFLKGTNEWFDYMGDIIFEILVDIEKYLKEKEKIRDKTIRRSPRQKIQRNLKPRLGDI